MLRSLLVTGVIVLGTSGAFAFGPGGGPPTQQMVRADSSGWMQVFYQTMVCIPETQTRAVTEKVPVQEEYIEQVNGEAVKKTRTVYKEVQKQVPYTVTKTVFEMHVRKANLDKVKAFETDGKAISAKKLKDRLTEDTLVVVSPNNQMIPDFYAGLFKPGTIILAFEQEAVTRPAMPVFPAPAPPQESNDDPKRQTGRNASPSIRFVSQPKEDNDAVEIRVPESAPAPMFPKTMPPVFVFASREGADYYNMRQLMESSFEVTGYKVKKQGTGKQMVPVKLTQSVRHNEITRISGKDLQFFTGDGAPIAVERIKEKLSREATVLYSADGEAVDPFWLQNFKTTTLVLVGPQLPGGCGGPMMGYGMPAPMSVPPTNAPLPGTAAPAPAPVPPAEAAQ